MGLDASNGLAAIGALALERLPDGRLVATGPLPSWCADLSRGGRPPDLRSPFFGEDVFPFLLAFLPEAEDAWRGYGRTRADSEFWTELDRDGREMHLEASAVRAGDARLLVIVRNERLFVKEQTFLQRARELRLTHDSLAREIEGKDILVHAIVHDLAAPLHSIMGILSLLEESELQESAVRWIELARQAATRQRELIAEILDVFAGSLGESTSPPSGRGADLTALCERVAVERDPVARMKDVRVKLSGNGASLRVVADEARLFRVITNLVDNAVRYSPAGATVRMVLASSGDDAVCLFVEDEGPGVAPEMMPRLFQKFARGRDASAGTGLGLFYCRITLEDWGGGIGYEPREGGGARFWVRLRRNDDGKAPATR